MTRALRSSFCKCLPALTPGRLFVVWLLLGAGGFPVGLEAQFKFREAPNRQMPTVLDEAGAMELLDVFRGNRAMGVFVLEGELIHRPPRAASTSFGLVMRGNWQAHSEHTMVELFPAGAAEPLSFEVIITGDDSSIDDLTTPVVDELPLRWFDLLMPWLGWEQVEYLGADRLLGRPAHRFAFSRQQQDSAGDELPHTVVATIDRDFAALLKADYYDAQQNLITRLRIDGFSRFGDVWMASAITWEQRASRHSLRLSVVDFSLSAP
jgi:hypothetical protein